jgi:glycosyltransferase involved in cell wall biosynthesis
VEGDGTEGVVMLPAHRGDLEAERKVRVLFVMIQMAMGGSERLIFNLVRNLDRRVFDPSIAWLTASGPLTEFQALGVPLHPVPKVSRFDWKAMGRLAKIIREQRIDVVNAHHFMPFVYAYYGARIANRAGLVYTEHSQADVLNVDPKSQLLGRYLLRSSNGAIGISEAVSGTIASHFGVDRGHIHTIENGVDTQLFGDVAARRRDIRQRLGLSEADVVIGHVANFRRNKNHLFLLRAFREVVRSRPGVKLLLVGQGCDGDAENSEPDVAEFVRSQGLGDSVQMLGYRPDVHELLGALDVFCLVSYKEGLPLSLIEAMASGLPVIGTDIDGIRPVIEAETNGLLTAPDDVPGLSAALNRLIDDTALRQRMGAEARRAARERYPLTRCVQQTQDLFLSIVPHAAVPIGAHASPAA